MEENVPTAVAAAVPQKIKPPLLTPFFLVLYGLAILLSPVIYMFSAIFLLAIFGTNPEPDKFLQGLIYLLASMILAVVCMAVSYAYLTGFLRKVLIIIMILPIVIGGVLIYQATQATDNEITSWDTYKSEAQKFSSHAIPIFESIKNEIPWISYNGCSPNFCFSPNLLYDPAGEISDEEISKLEDSLQALIPVKDSVDDKNSRGFLEKKDGVNLMTIPLFSPSRVCDNGERFKYVCELHNSVRCYKEVESCSF